MTDKLGPDHADENGSDPPNAFVKANKFVVVGEALPPRERVQAYGQAMQPFENLRSDLGVAESTLGEFRGPTTRVSGTTLLKAADSFLEVLLGWPPASGITCLSERGAFGALMRKEFLRSSIPFSLADVQGRRGPKLAPSFAKLSLGRRFVKSLGSVGRKTLEAASSNPGLCS